MKVYVATFGFGPGNPNIFRTLDSAMEFVQDQQSEDKWVWHFLEDDEAWYFTPDKDDDTPEETWAIVETEVQ